MKATKYTREQLVQAINYWTTKLRRVDETTSSNYLIDDLIEKFGSDLVLSKTPTYVLSEIDLEKIFDILNRNLFESKLRKPFLKYVPEQSVVNRLNDNSIASGCFTHERKDARCYGVYLSSVTDIVDRDGNAVGVHFSDDQIIMNETYLGKCIFIFAVAAICHEMIHYYQRNQPDFDDVYFKMSNGSIDAINLHDQETFEDKMLEANELGLKVVKQQNPSESYLDMNFGARNKLYRVIGEDDDDDVIVAQTGGMTILRTRGSYKSCLQVLD